MAFLYKVSIPFKRESVSQVLWRDVIGEFFKVSIPFKRESVSQVTCKNAKGEEYQSFNSLQTGKRIPRHCNDTWSKTLTEFQFPSNGKAYPKLIN